MTYALTHLIKQVKNEIHIYGEKNCCHCCHYCHRFVDGIAEVAAADAVTAVTAVTDLQDKQSIFKASVFKSISNNQSAEDACLNTRTSNTFLRQLIVSSIKYFKPNVANRNISTNYVNNNIQTPRHNLDQEQKIIPNQHNKQKGQEDSTVSFSPTCEQPSLPHH